MNPKFQELTSSEIDKAQLKRVPDVLQKYKELRTECKITLMAVKLAREAFFGDGILKRCTPRGWNELPALPQAELNQRKPLFFINFHGSGPAPKSSSISGQLTKSQLHRRAKDFESCKQHQRIVPWTLLLSFHTY